MPDNRHRHFCPDLVFDRLDTDINLIGPVQAKLWIVMLDDRYNLDWLALIAQGGR